MALNIKNEAVVSLARQVAQETGESLTDAVHVALLERLERLTREHEREARMARIRRLSDQLAAELGPYDAGMTTDDLYDDETGLPR